MRDDGVYSRREALKLTGAAGGALSLGAVGITAFRFARSSDDGATDGIPAVLKQSSSFNRELEETFGSQFDGLEPGRRDLLVDARYVGSAEISSGTKREIEEMYRDRDIFLQWLDHPDRYDASYFNANYGYRVEDLLYPQGSFYGTEVEPNLKNVALQMIVLPDVADKYPETELYSRLWEQFGDDPTFSGMSLGNRAVVSTQSSSRSELILNLHEIGHLALCHPRDPDNAGVMATPYEGGMVDYTDSEWERLRSNLEHIHDPGGFEVLTRPCVWREMFSVGFRCQMPL